MVLLDDKICAIMAVITVLDNQHVLSSKKIMINFETTITNFVININSFPESQLLQLSNFE